MKLTCVVLAAGEGKRMNSNLPKVIHRICGRPMLDYIIGSAEKLRSRNVIVVVGDKKDEIKKALRGGSAVSFITQESPKGTGDALLKARKAIEDDGETILVLNGDMPLITADTLKRFLSLHRKNNDVVSVLSFIAKDPSSYGRILRDASGKAFRIIEEKDASPQQKAVEEVNSGVYVIKQEAMALLKRLRINKKKGEYYLTDLLEIAAGEGSAVGVYCLGREDELMGVNTRQELLGAQVVLQRRIINGLMGKGVSFIDAASAHIHHDVRIGRDTVIYPNVCLEGDTRIGDSCSIFPNVRIINSCIGSGAVIKDSSVIENSVVGHNAQVGPFAHIRPESVIGPYAKIGNFVEVKKSLVGENTKASHLSYIGDTIIGKDVNIGAGTITCNYDGRDKHKTVIHDGVFIGSDSQLIAPVSVGKGAYVGAGSTITEDVPPMSLAISRIRQKNIKGWALKRQLKVKSKK